MRLSVVPCYGRDYKSAKVAKEDFEAGKDFKIADMSSQYDGKYVSIRDCKPGDTINLRYKHLTQVTVYTVKGI